MRHIQRQADAHPRAAWQIRDILPSDPSWMKDEYGGDTEYQPYGGGQLITNTPPSGKWYHVSPYSIPVGTLLTPGGGESPDEDFYEELSEAQGGWTNRQNYVWVAQNLGAAYEWSDSLRCPYIYRVHPKEPPQPWNFDGGNGYVTRGAVIRELISSTGAPKGTSYEDHQRLYEERWRLTTAGSNGGLPPRLRIVQDRPNRVIAYDDDSTDAWNNQYGIAMLSWNDDGVISWVGIQDDDYLRRGVATALLEYVRRNIRPDIKHSDDLSESGAGWARATGQRVAYPKTQGRARTASQILYRGLNIDLLDLSVPEDFYDLVENGLGSNPGGVATRILDWLTSGAYRPTLGRFWTTDRSVAEWFSTGQGQAGSDTASVVLEAQWNGDGETKSDLSWDNYSDEKQVLLRTGTPLTITGMWINGKSALGSPRAVTAVSVDDLMDLLGPSFSTSPAPSTPEPAHAGIPGVPTGWEPYVEKLLASPDYTHTADLILPTSVVAHYAEYQRSGPNLDALKYVVQRRGIWDPVEISTDGERALLHEGNHRLAAAQALGIGQIPVRVSFDRQVLTNSGKTVALEPVLAAWTQENRHRMTWAAAKPDLRRIRSTPTNMLVRWHDQICNDVAKHPSHTERLEGIRDRRSDAIAAELTSRAEQGDQIAQSWLYC